MATAAMELRRSAMGQEQQQLQETQPLPPAHSAASQGDVAELKRLYSDNRYRPAKSDPATGETPMHSAVRAKKLVALKFLLENNYIDPQARAKNGETAAHIACCEGWLEGLQALCNHDKRRRTLIITDQDLQGLTPLHISIISCRESLVEWILENFTGDQLKVMEQGSLAVHFAAASGNVAIMKMLVRHAGIECVNMRDDNGTTPVYFAAQEGQVETLKYLIVECDVDGRTVSNDGMQPIHAATQNGRLHAVKYLVGKMGRSLLQERTNDGATPVHFAAAGGHTDILKWMLNSQNSSVLAKVCDTLQSTPAHDAVDYGHLECLKVLLKHNADLFAVDDDGTSPYSLAMSQDDSEVKAFVQEHMRTRRINPPSTQLPVSSEWDEDVYQAHPSVSHPIVPPTQGSQLTMSTSVHTDDTGATTISVATLDTQSDEIRAAQQQVMAHRLSSALEVVSEQQSTEDKRMTRNRSMANVGPAADPNLRHGETVAAGLELKHRSRKVSTSLEPGSTAAAAASSDSGWADRPIVHRIGSGVAAAGLDDSDSDESKSEETRVKPEERRDPDGQEHGTSGPGVDSWFAESRQRTDTISDRAPMPLPQSASIDDTDVAMAEEDEMADSPKKRHLHQTQSWYSSDGEPLISSQLTDLKKQSKGVRRSGKKSRRSQRMPIQYMPVLQPMMTPYGPMMTQTLMPMPGKAGGPRKRSHYGKHTTSTKSKKTDTGDKDQEAAGSKPSLGVVSEEDEFETETGADTGADTTLPRSAARKDDDTETPRKRSRKEIKQGLGKKNASRRRSSTAPYGVFPMPSTLGRAPQGVMPPMTPPGMMAPGMMAPGMMAPGMMSMMGSGMMTQSMPKGMKPPGMMAPGMMPPGMMAPGMMPPGMMAPGMMPPGMMGMMAQGMPKGMSPPGMMAPGMMPMMAPPNGKGFGHPSSMMGGIYPMMGGTMPMKNSPRSPPMSPKSPTVPPRRESVMHRILGKRSASKEALYSEDITGRRGGDAIYDTAAYDPYELPIDYKDGSSIAELVINSSVIGLGIIATIPRRQTTAGLQPAATDSNFLLGNTSTAGLGEPMSLEEARLLSAEDHDQVGEPFRPPAKVVPGDRRIGALSKLAKRLSHRKIRTEEHDDVSARSSTAWEFSNRMEKQATANWVNSGHMPEGLAALTPEDVTPAKPSGGRKKTKKKDTPDAFSPTTTVEGVGYGRKTSGSNAVLGIFASDNSHNPYKMNVATTMDLDESLFDRKAADGQKDAPQNDSAEYETPSFSRPRSQTEGRSATPQFNTPPPPATPPPPRSPPPPPGPPPPPPLVPETEKTARSTGEKRGAATSPASHGEPADLYSLPIARRDRTQSDSSAMKKDTSPGDLYAQPNKKRGPEETASSRIDAAAKSRKTLSEMYARSNKKPTNSQLHEDAPTAPYAKPVPKALRQVAVRDGEGQESVSTVASTAKARQHINRVVKNDVSAMLTDSGDDMSEISALKSTTTSVVSPMANKSKPAAAVAAPPDNDDPFGLSELALALQMAGEPEYWKESLSFSPETETKAVPEFKSAAAVEASAAAAVVFDESILDTKNTKEEQKKALQPAQGSLAAPKIALSPADDVMATVAALADFGDDTSSTKKPSVPERGVSMPHQETKMVRGKSKSSWVNAASASKPPSTQSNATAATKRASVKVSTGTQPSLTVVSVQPSAPKLATLSSAPSSALSVPEVSALPGTPGAARKMWKQMTKKIGTEQSAVAPKAAPAATTNNTSGFHSAKTSKPTIPKSPPALSPTTANPVKAPVLSVMNAKKKPPSPPSSDRASDELAKVFERRRTKAAQNAFLDSYKKAADET